MDAIQKFRHKRIKRLENRFGEYHGHVRFDDEEESNAPNNKSGGGGHGNTRIPFGLCQREGITIEEGWTPTDAWNALEGKGYSAGAVYNELKKTGKVSSGKPEKPKMSDADFKKAIKTINDYRKKEKKFERIDKEKRKAESRLRSVNNSIRFNEGYVADYLSRAKDILEQYDYEEEKMSPRDRELYRSYKEYANTCNDHVARYREEQKELNEKIGEIDKKIEDLGWDKEDESYKTSISSILKTSKMAENAREYRGIEDETKEQRKKLAEADKKIESAKSLIELCERRGKMEEERGNETGAKFYQERLESAKKKLESLEEERKPIADDLSGYDQKMSEAKGDAKDADWKLVYGLTVDEDTVENGPYDKLEPLAKRLRSMSGIKYLAPVKYVKTPSEEDIISKVGGFDKNGCCVSLACAYMANKAGYEVLDFRGGDSRTFFSMEWKRFSKLLGCDSEKGTNDYETSKAVLSRVESGKEYWFSTGNHAAIVKRVNGTLQYLELQGHPEENGWKELNDSVLKSRFRCKKSRSQPDYSTLVEASKIVDNQEFFSLMGYINTEEDKQKKSK